MASVPVSFFSDLPLGDELLTKPERMLLKCRENVYAPNPFCLPSLSIMPLNLVKLFPEKLDDFHFCSRLKSFGNMPELISSGFPLFNPAPEHTDEAISPFSRV